jgi:cyclohexanone monooxygenase
VFQRTANYTIPAQDRPLTEEESREVKADYPRLRERSRHTFAGLPLTPSEYSALEVRPDERERVYEQGWRKGGFHFLFSAYHDILFDSEANETAAEFVREKIRSIVDEPATAELLCPRDYPLGSKRLVTDTDYFVTFNRDNVRLVDVRSAPIQRITADGLETAGGHYALDAIVFATGFDAMTGSLLRMDIRGRGGVCLAERWADGIARNYLGLQVAGFPNMFTITGPGSPSVLSNMVLSIEQHVDWIAACLADMSRHGRSSIEATEAAEASWVEHQVQLTNATLFPQGDSWYLGANIPGKGRFFTPYPGGVGPYRKICDDVAGKGYEGFTFAA